MLDETVAQHLIAPIGILGGTFDPIHHGHLRLAVEAVEQCRLREVHFVPTGTPPHRQAPQASGEQRLKMVQLALHANSFFVADARESYRTDECYTVDTLTALRTEVGNQQPLCLLLGSDAFLQLNTWSRWHQLFDLAHIVVMQRPGRPLGNLMTQAVTELQSEYATRLAPSPKALHEVAHGHIVVIDMPGLDISATDIRRRIATHHSVRYLVPDSVAHFIQSNNLYLNANY